MWFSAVDCHISFLSQEKAFQKKLICDEEIPLSSTVINEHTVMWFKVQIDLFTGMSGSQSLTGR